jgi:hypothetical protein
MITCVSTALGQETSLFLQDSIYVDRGISGTTDFEPQTRIFFKSYDERGRVLQQLRERLGEDGLWHPQSRRMFTYDGDNLVEMHIQMWSINNEIWLDTRKDLYTYEDGMRTEFIRQKAPQGQLENERRWQYSYDEDGQQTDVLLQQWNNGLWENLSRKVVTLNENGDPESQVLQVWYIGEWRNVKSREWAYETAGGRSRVQATRIRVWSADKNDWVDQNRKIFQYNDDGLWMSSRIEAWNENTQQWVNSDRMQHSYNEENQPNGQQLQIWDGNGWENRGLVSFTYKDRQFLSQIETWNKAAGEWNNFLRYRVDIDDQNLLASRVGMQAWNSEAMMWENRQFTERYTYYWSEAIVNSVEEAGERFSCTIPNPYSGMNSFFCDLPLNQRGYQLELYDLLGRPVYQLKFRSGEALSIDQKPSPGMYVLRIHDQEKLHHLQRLIIH